LKALITYKCQAPKCDNQIELGLWCDECEKGFLEDVMLMSTPPSFFWRIYESIADRIDNLSFKIELFHGKRKYRREREKKRLK